MAASRAPFKASLFYFAVEYHGQGDSAPLPQPPLGLSQKPLKRREPQRDTTFFRIYSKTNILRKILSLQSTFQAHEYIA